MLPRLVDARGEELTRQAVNRFNKKRLKSTQLKPAVHLAASCGTGLAACGDACGLEESGDQNHPDLLHEQIAADSEDD